VVSRTHIWFASFVVIIFAAGLAAGVALDRTIGGNRRFAGPGGPGGPGSYRGDRGGSDRGDRGSGAPSNGSGGGRGDGPPTQSFVRDLDTLLDLTPDQETKVAEIIDASRPTMRQLQAEASQKFTAHQQLLRDSLIKVLTPEQAKKFEEAQSRGPFGFRWRGGRGR
jgi:Spy/CpxP family protein refolding chaperone